MSQQPQTQQPPKQTQTPPTTGDKRKKSAQDYKKETEENKKRWMPLVRYMRKQGMKFKTARCGKFRIEYFRADQLEELAEGRKEDIAKNAVLSDLVRCWEAEVVYFERPENLPKFKYPKELEKSEGNSKSKFASFKFDTAEPKTWLFPTILIAIIAVVLFPLWPYILKYSVFMVCLVLVTAILSLIALRLVIYLVFAIFGVSFWILPNFFADVSISDSFLPVYSVKKWQTGVFSIVGRILALSVVGYYAYHVYIDSSWIFENIEITKTSFDDLHDWGVGKIKGEKNFSQSALTNLDHIMNQTADVHVEESLDLGGTENTESLDQQNEGSDKFEGDVEKASQQQEEDSLADAPEL